MEVKKSRTAVYHTNYHIVFCPKYRHEVFEDERADYLRDLFQRLIEKRGWEVVAIEVRPDHVHLFVRGIEPQVSLSGVVKYLKGVSGISLFKKYPELREKFRNGRLWSKSYYVGTAGEVSSEVIKRYIERVEHE